MQLGNVQGDLDQELTNEEWVGRMSQRLTLNIKEHAGAVITVRGEHTPGRNSDAIFVNAEPASLEQQNQVKPEILLLVADGTTNTGEAARLFTGDFVAKYITPNLPKIFTDLDLEQLYKFPSPHSPLQEGNCLTFDELYRWLLPHQTKINAFSDPGAVLRYILKKYKQTFWKPQLKEGAPIYLELTEFKNIVQDGNKLRFLLKNNKIVDELSDGTKVADLIYYDEGKVKLNQVVVRAKTLQLLKGKSFIEIASLIFGPDLFKPNTKKNVILRLFYALHEVTSRLSEVFSNEFKEKFEGAQYLESASTLAGVIETEDAYIHFSVGDTLVFSVDTNGEVVSNTQTVASNSDNILHSFIGSTLSIGGTVTPHYPKVIDVKILPKSEAKEKNLLTIVMTDGVGKACKIPALAKMLAVCSADEAVEVIAGYLKMLFTNTRPDDATAAFLEI